MLALIETNRAIIMFLVVSNNITKAKLTEIVKPYLELFSNAFYESIAAQYSFAFTNTDYIDAGA